MIPDPNRFYLAEAKNPCGSRERKVKSLLTTDIAQGGASGGDAQILAFAFGAIERRIGAIEGRIGGIAAAQLRDAAGGRDQYRRAAKMKSQLRDRHAQLVCNAFGGFGRKARH